MGINRRRDTIDKTLKSQKENGSVDTLLSNPEFIAELERGRDDFRRGRYSSIEEVMQRRLGESPRPRANKRRKP